MPFEVGHTHSMGPKPKLIYDAIMREVKQNPAKLKQAVESVLNKAAEGDLPALDWLTTRLEGKAAQAVTVSGDADAPLVSLIRMIVVQPDNSNDINSLRTIEGEKIASLDTEQVAGTPTPLPQSVILAEAPGCDEPPPTFSKNAE